MYTFFEEAPFFCCSFSCWGGNAFPCTECSEVKKDSSSLQLCASPVVEDLTDRCTFVYTLNENWAPQCRGGFLSSVFCFLTM